MVHLGESAFNITSRYDCDTWINSYVNLTAIKICQNEARTPYCWPPNGTRICVPTYDIPFYWPPKYYEENSSFDFSYESRRRSYGSNNKTHRNNGTATLGTLGITEYIRADDIPGRDNENSLNITILEWQYRADLVKEIRHQGPILILVNPLRERPDATAPVKPDSGPKFTSGVIMGITFGSIIGAAIIFTILFRCCCDCCGCLHRNEIKRIRQQQFLREQRERGTENPVGVTPISTRAGASMVPVGSDEIRVAEEHRVEQRRQEIVRVEAGEPPAYEAPPPKYTP